MKQTAPYGVVGAGLAGSELAWQLARSGERVVLFEMRPKRKSPAHRSGLFAELVCSNSFRSANPENAVGLLKEEMTRLGSLVMEVAHLARVPAGDAWAVDRGQFASLVTEKMSARTGIEKVNAEVTALLPHRGGIEIEYRDGLDTPCTRVAEHVICATGPLTSPPLHDCLQTLLSEQSLYFYDSIAPIVDAESIDTTQVFRASRYGKGDADYLNCPLEKEDYDRLIDALLIADKVPINEVDRPIFFEACLPIEVMAERGRDTLRFGPMKPVGLEDPRTGKRPYAVVQLRKENKEGSCYNLVGFQTRLKQGEQKRVFSMIPGLKHAEFLRYGAMHRNTYLHSPTRLTDHLECKSLAGLYFAGQMTGVEGYIESAAIGLLLGKLLPLWKEGRDALPPPPTTALGALFRHLREENSRYEPHNVHFGLFSPLGGTSKKKDRKLARLERARHDFGQWLGELMGDRV